jgi:aerobic-type carbon monoxide dehydrogenase small subunit (CoxS/CutS family)
MEIISFTLNHKPVRLSLETDQMLLWVLRTQLGLTGTKYGCGEGFCGSCTVLLNHTPVRSCQVPILEVKDKEVLTIEGLTADGKIHPLQEAFMEHDAVQCGYCTPGMIMNAYGLLKKNPEPTETDIIQAMEGNLCRCSTYNRVILAIHSAARVMAGGRP